MLYLIDLASTCIYIEDSIEVSTFQGAGLDLEGVHCTVLSMI